MTWIGALLAAGLTGGFVVWSLSVSYLLWRLAVWAFWGSLGAYLDHQDRRPG